MARAPLEVFKTSRRGWGLRCRRALARGELVCEYAGELLSSEAARRQRRLPNYVLVVREHSRSGTWRTIIDLTHTGNVGRFANHSVTRTSRCTPFASRRPCRASRLASRDVGALEELTISHGDSGAGGGAAPGARTPCECGAAEAAAGPVRLISLGFAAYLARTGVNSPPSTDGRGGSLVGLLALSDFALQRIASSC